MNNTQEAVDSLRFLAEQVSRLQGITLVADVLARIGSLEGGEAEAKLRTARARTDAFEAEDALSKARASLKSTAEKAAHLVTDAQDKAANIVTEAQTKAAGILAEAASRENQVNAAIAAATTELQALTSKIAEAKAVRRRILEEAQS